MSELIAVSDLVLGQPMEFTRDWDGPAMLFLKRVHDLFQQAFGDLPYIGGHVRAGQGSACQIHNEFRPESREPYPWYLHHGEVWQVAVLMYFPEGGGEKAQLELRSTDFSHRRILAAKLSSFCRMVRDHNKALGEELARRFAEQFDLPVEVHLR